MKFGIIRRFQFFFIRPTKILACILLTCGVLFSTASSATQDDQVIPAPDVIKQTLLNGSSNDVKQLSNKLNICEDGVDSVEIHRVKLVPQRTHVVLQINSLSGCRETYLVILQESRPNTWSHFQTIVLWDKHVAPRISFDSLISPNETEIIVRDNETGSGTGIQQIDMTIWKLMRERLVVVFDEATYVNFSIPVDARRSLNSDQQEDSDFVFVNAKSGKEIMQKQVIRDHRTRITRWWSWLWDPSVERFRKYATWGAERGQETKGSRAH